MPAVSTSWLRQSPVADQQRVATGEPCDQAMIEPPSRLPKDHRGRCSSRTQWRERGPALRLGEQIFVGGGKGGKARERSRGTTPKLRKKERALRARRWREKEETVFPEPCSGWQSEAPPTREGTARPPPRELARIGMRIEGMVGRFYRRLNPNPTLQWPSSCLGASAAAGGRTATIAGDARGGAARVSARMRRPGSGGADVAGTANHKS